MSWLAAYSRGATQLKKAEVLLWAEPAYTAFLNGCWYLFWTDAHLFWVAKPTVAIRNANGLRQLHNERGPAVVNDIENYYFLNGVLVPEWLVETQAEQVDPRKILEIDNAEVRREFVRKIGAERLCQKLDAVTLDSVGDYSLLRLNIGGRDYTYLKMLNPSVGCWHVEGVDRNCTTVEQAIHWRKPPALQAVPVNDVNGEDYFQQGDVCIWPKSAKSVKRLPLILT